jgi:hypothetical protein
MVLNLLDIRPTGQPKGSSMASFVQGNQGMMKQQRQRFYRVTHLGVHYVFDLVLTAVYNLLDT